MPVSLGLNPAPAPGWDTRLRFPGRALEVDGAEGVEDAEDAARGIPEWNQLGHDEDEAAYGHTQAARGHTETWVEDLPVPRRARRCSCPLWLS